MDAGMAEVVMVTGTVTMDAGMVAVAMETGTAVVAGIVIITVDLAVQMVA